MKRKPVEGEIHVYANELMIEQAQDINAGHYHVYVRNGYQAYDGIRYTNRGRVVLFYKFTAPGTGDCERWVNNRALLHLVPTGKPE